MFYSILKRFLFLFDAEVSHHIALKSLKFMERIGLGAVFPSVLSDKVTVMGIEFPNRVGLAAGLDKNGDYIDALGSIGFGFLEIGTVTPVAQSGNSKPRLFRLTADNAIINRMGFNNKGVGYLVEQVKKRKFGGVIGINIGKNKATPDEAAILDYERCLELVYPHADYITVNVSSPNTPGLRALQFGKVFSDLLKALKSKQMLLCEKHEKYVPLAVKIAPDMPEEEIKNVVDTLLDVEIDAVIATNTTVSREGLKSSVNADESGGLSGEPVFERSNLVISTISSHLKYRNLDKKLPIIGVGGIANGQQALAKIKAGASLVQVYTGFIYRGPILVKEAVETLIENKVSY